MIGILAYGSLINDPGEEIRELIINRIECITPFRVEFARSSKTRSGAPTLIPYEDGEYINAQILVLNSNDVEYIKTLLWRRETHQITKKVYKESNKESINKVKIIMLHDFKGIETVLYTSISSNIDVDIDILSTLAIKSIDGIKYLMDVKLNGIRTKLSSDYEKMILEKTNTNSLLEAFNKLTNDHI